MGSFHRLYVDALLYGVLDLIGGVGNFGFQYDFGCLGNLTRHLLYMFRISLSFFIISLNPLLALESRFFPTFVGGTPGCR